MLTINQEQLLNIINTNDVSFLLGAGCSLSSGCMGAQNLVYEFKKRIYCNDNSQQISKFDFLSDDLKQLLDRYFDNKSVNNEYSYYFEKCFPLKSTRMQFIKTEFLDKQPSVGYKCFAKTLLEKNTKIVYTTNFDNLIEKAIRSIDLDYDISKVNDKYVPLTQSKIIISELHGDYNYALPKNTEEELKSLSNEATNSIISCPSQILVILGYSGADMSVMNALKKYVETNKTKSIIWCAYNNQINVHITELMEYARTINEDSCICNFRGFDELFLSYYKQYLSTDENIDKMIIDKPVLNYSNSYALNKKELLNSNLFEITELPQINLIANVEYTKELYEKVNEIDVGQFHNKNLYFIGDINRLKDILKIENITTFQMTPQFIKQYYGISVRLLKDYIMKCILNKNSNIKQKNNKLYFYDSKDYNNIFNGFSIDVININNKIYLSFLQEFICESDINQHIKIQILKKFSSLRNNSSFVWLSNLTSKLGHSFDIWGTSLKYSINSLVLSDLDYTLLDEPLITTNNISNNISALQCIKKFGIHKPLLEKKKIKISILCPIESKKELATYFKNLDSELKSSDGIYPDYLGFEKMFNTKLEYEVINFSLSDCKSISFYSYCEFLLNKMEGIKKNSLSDLIVIYTPKELENFEQSDNLENNLHDYIKLFSANKYITQFISQKSINSTDAIYKKMWNLAIAIYTKTIGLPWQPDTNISNNAFVGIGYGMSHEGITVGCSQMFDSHGRGLQLLLKPISTNSKNPYMTENEAFEVGRSLCNMYYNYYPTRTLENIVIHKLTPFKKNEINGLDKAFSHINNLELIQIQEKPQIKGIKLFDENNADSYPISRGTLVKINDNEALLWTHGVVKSVGFNRDKPYVKGGKGYPSPILIKRFRGNLPLENIARDILMLTKMDYNSADILYSNMPVTIKYTNKVVDIIKQDSNSLEEVDFRYII